jgi:carbon monoxide dehydrogenase subunit G
MIFHEEFILDCTHAEAWKFLSNFPSPIMVIPGVVEVTELAPHQYDGAVRVHIGPCTFVFHGHINVTLINHDTKQVNLSGWATDNVLGGHFKGRAYTQTLPLGANRSCVKISVEVDLGGILGKLGSIILRPKARQVVNDYAKLVTREIKRRRMLTTVGSPSLPAAV